MTTNTSEALRARLEETEDALTEWQRMGVELLKERDQWQRMVVELLRERDQLRTKLTEAEDALTALRDNRDAWVILAEQAQSRLTAAHEALRDIALRVGRCTLYGPADSAREALAKGAALAAVSPTKE